MTCQPSQAFCAPCRRGGGGGGGACGVARMKRPTHFVLVESSLFTSVVVSWLHIAVILHYYIMLPRDPMLLAILEKRGEVWARLPCSRVQQHLLPFYQHLSTHNFLMASSVKQQMQGTNIEFRYLIRKPRHCLVQQRVAGAVEYYSRIDFVNLRRPFLLHNK